MKWMGLATTVAALSMTGCAHKPQQLSPTGSTALLRLDVKAPQATPGGINYTSTEFQVPEAKVRCVPPSTANLHPGVAQSPLGFGQPQSGLAQIQPPVQPQLQPPLAQAPQLKAQAPSAAQAPLPSEPSEIGSQEQPPANIEEQQPLTQNQQQPLTQNQQQPLTQNQQQPLAQNQQQPEVAANKPGAGCSACGPINIHFDFDSDQLSADSRQLLNESARCLEGNHNLSVSIEGATDDQGSAEYNQDLGQRRANAVAAYLRSVGVADSQVATLSLGKNQPVCESQDESCREQNRRAVVLPRNLEAATSRRRM